MSLRILTKQWEQCPSSGDLATRADNPCPIPPSNNLLGVVDTVRFPSSTMYLMRIARNCSYPKLDTADVRDGLVVSAAGASTSTSAGSGNGGGPSPPTSSIAPSVAGARAKAAGLPAASALGGGVLASGGNSGGGVSGGSSIAAPTQVSAKQASSTTGGGAFAALFGAPAKAEDKPAASGFSFRAPTGVAAQQASSTTGGGAFAAGVFGAPATAEDKPAASGFSFGAPTGVAAQQASSTTGGGVFAVSVAGGGDSSPPMSSEAGSTENPAARPAVYTSGAVSANRSERVGRTKWGTLKLVEPPPSSDPLQPFRSSNNVPREICLEGKVRNIPWRPWQ